MNGQEDICFVQYNMMAASFKHMPQQQSSAVSLDSCYSDLDNALKSGQASEIHIIMRDIIAELEN